MLLFCNQKSPLSNGKRAGTVLLVEDDVDNAEFLRLVITTETHYDVLLMRSGRETLEHLEEIKVSNPVLFLLDYHLPPTNALDLYNQMHATTALMHVPTLIATAGRLSDELRQTLAQQYIQVIEKPFEIDALLDCIKQAIDCTPRH